MKSIAYRVPNNKYIEFVGIVESFEGEYIKLRSFNNDEVRLLDQLGSEERHDSLVGILSEMGLMSSHIRGYGIGYFNEENGEWEKVEDKNFRKEAFAYTHFQKVMTMVMSIYCAP